MPSLEVSGITEGVQSRLMNLFASMGDVVASATSHVMMKKYMFAKGEGSLMLWFVTNGKSVRVFTL